MAEDTQSPTTPPTSGKKDEGPTANQQLLLDIENSPAFTPEQSQIIARVLEAADPDAAHGGYTKDGVHLWKKDAGKAHQIVIDENGNQKVLNG